jgi:hypothetical protein
VAFVEIFRDNFDDGIQSLRTFGDGSITESAGVLHITNSGLNIDWWMGAGNAPIACLGLNENNVDGYDVIRYETRITSFTGSGSTKRSCGMTILTQDRLNWIQFHFRENTDKILVQRGIDGVGGAIVETGVVVHPSSVPLRLRMTWHRNSNTVTCEYGENDGTTGYTYAASASLKERPAYVGLFGREWYARTPPTFNIEYDWLSVEVDNVNPEAFNYSNTGLVDEVELLDQPTTAGDRHTFPQISPGESTHEKSGAFTEEVDLLDQPTTAGDRHTFPQISPGEIKIDPGAGFGDAIDFIDQPSTAPNRHTYPQISPGERKYLPGAGQSDYTSVDLQSGPTFMSEKNDADGYELLGDFRITDVIYIDTTQDSFGNPDGYNHWGAARDGKFYANGIECLSEGYDFGTLAGGFRTSAWRFPGVEPFATGDGTTIFALTSDDHLRIQGTWGAWANPGGTINSIHKWYLLAGDFDIQVDYSNYVVNAGSEGESRLAINANNQNGSQQFYINRDANGTYRTAWILDGGDPAGGTTGTSDTSGKLRITRVSGVLTGYKWNGSGWDQVGSTLNDSRLQGIVWVQIGCSGNNNTNTDITFSNFLITEGDVTSYAGWSLEGTGANRGIRDDMPEQLGIACTETSVDLFDVANNRMWMRFVRSGDNALHYYSDYGQRPWKVRWSNGTLMIAHGSLPTQDQEGGAIWVDFTTDVIRIHREHGGFVGGAWNPIGGISQRNDNLRYSGEYDNWDIQDYRVYDVDIWHTDGYEFRAVANNEGLAVFRELRWYYQDPHGLEKSEAAETNRMRWCEFDEYDGYLFYMDDSKIYSAERGNFGSGTGWEGYMDGGTFTNNVEKDLPSAFTLTDEQYRAILFSGYVFMAAREGVYISDWPGAWELLYGKVGSGATYEILPNYTNISAIAIQYNGSTPLLFCSLEGAVIQELENRDGWGVRMVVINLNTDTIWARSKIYKNWVSSSVAIGV